jgi:hypothetical protein
MEPISATIALIAAAKGAVETASNIKDIGSSLEALFSDSEKDTKKKKKPTPTAKSRMQQVLRMRTGEGTEAYEENSTSYASVANDVLQKKQQALALKSLASEINKKWPSGPGEKSTWEQIIDQRQRLLKEKAAADQLAKETALQKKAADRAFWKHALLICAQVGMLFCFVGLIVVFLWWASTANINDLR